MDYPKKLATQDKIQDTGCRQTKQTKNTTQKTKRSNTHPQ